MRGDVDVAAAAALLAYPTRAALLIAVIDEGPLPARELAARAGVRPSTASEHLARLVDGGFVERRTVGRHRYYRLASAAVAEAVEALALVAPQQPVRSLRDATTSAMIRRARTCYDHLAGHLGVSLAEALARRDVIVAADGGYAIGPAAEARLAGLGIDLDSLKGQRRPLVRGCLDWSERELHLAGAVGAAVTTRLFELGWIERRPRTRAVLVTPTGAKGLARELGVELAASTSRT